MGALSCDFLMCTAVSRIAMHLPLLETPLLLFAMICEGNRVDRGWEISPLSMGGRTGRRWQVGLRAIQAMKFWCWIFQDNQLPAFEGEVRASLYGKRPCSVSWRRYMWSQEGKSVLTWSRRRRDWSVQEDLVHGGALP